MTDEMAPVPWPPGAGEMAGRVRAFDWSRTSLGPIESWPQNLRTIVDLMMANPVANILVYGPERVLIYNDACIPLYGKKHPDALGLKGPEVFAELWGEIGPLYDRVFAGEKLRFMAQPWAFERGPSRPTGLYDAYFAPGHDESGKVAFAYVTAIEVTDKARTEAVLRESQERQAFLLRLSDTLRPLEDSGDIQLAASRTLGEHLGVDRCFYFVPQWENGEQINVIERDFYRAAGMPSLVGRYPVRAFGAAIFEPILRGEIVAIPDVEALSSLSPKELQSHRAVNARTFVSVPLFKKSEYVAGFGIIHSEPRQWTGDEIALIEETAERTWSAVERGRTEEALRESEEKYRTLFETMNQGYGECEMIRDREGRAIDYRIVAVNPAFERLTGAPAANAQGRTAREILPDLEDWWVETFDEMLRTNTPVRVEREVAGLGGWYEVSGYPKGGERFAYLFDDITGRKRAEMALRESEDRQAFLLKLSDAMRPLTDPNAIQEAACRILGEHLGAARVDYAEVEGEEYVVANEYRIAGLPSMAGRYPIDSFRPAERAAFEAGRTTVIRDIEAEPGLTADEAAAYASINARSFAAVPLVKGGRLVVVFNVIRGQPSDWSPHEVALVEETAERTWAAMERARADAALSAELADARRLQETSTRLIGSAELADARRLQETSTRLIGEESPDALYDDLLVTAIALMRADFGSLQLHDPGQNMLRLLAWKDFHPDSAAFWERVWIDSASTCGKALETGERIIVADVEESGFMEGSEDLRQYRQSGIRAVQSTPLISRGGRMLGMISTHWRKPHEPSERDLNLLDVLARQAADLMERTQADASLRESEDRQAFLLRVNDELRHLADPAEIQGAAARLLVEHLDANRAMYLEFEGDEETTAAVIRGQYARDVPPFPGRVPYADFAKGFPVEALKDHATLVVDDTANDSRLSDDVRTAWLGTNVAAALAVSLVKHGRMVANFSLHNAVPREWTPMEIRLVEDVADRTWAAVERARAEAALRESEERFRQFGDASSDVLWIRDAEKLQWEYLSPAFEAIYGEPRDEALTSDTLRNWLDLIVPEDRKHALENIRRVRGGERVTFEFRIRRPSDGKIRWLRNTDFPLFDQARRVQRIGGVGHDATEEKEAAERMKVLVAELQHRTRNLVAVVRSLADRTVRENHSLDAFKTSFGERLAAVARVQGLLSRLDDGRRVTFDELLNAELAAHGALVTDGGKVTLEGPADVPLRSGTVQTFALALHELATNAVKYGALSSQGGQLVIRWQIKSNGAVPELHVDWRESGVVMPDVDAEPQGGGYGRELIERALPYQLSATTSYVLGADGVHCTIAVPISDAAAPDADNGWYR